MSFVRANRHNIASSLMPADLGSEREWRPSSLCLTFHIWAHLPPASHLFTWTVHCPQCQLTNIYSMALTKLQANDREEESLLVTDLARIKLSLFPLDVLFPTVRETCQGENFLWKFLTVLTQAGCQIPLYFLAGILCVL